MRRQDFEHVISAAAMIAGEDEIVVIGSQAILGSHPDAPSELLRSMEADVYPRRDPTKADAIDAALGDGSQFHRTYGYYAHGVGPETARAPSGWEQRLIETAIAARPGQEKGALALCLEPHDLVLSKCAAGRQRDWNYLEHALGAGIVRYEVLRSRIDDLPLDAAARDRVRSMTHGRAQVLGMI